jgi:anthranilate phosphoribosyltransferase
MHMQFVGDIRKLLLRAPLDEDAATRLWGAILDEAVDDIEVGAVLGTLTTSGATGEELAGLHRAVEERMERVPLVSGGARAVAIPAYGLVPGEALMVSLAAALLARFEVPVAIHGVLDSPGGVSSVCVLRELGVLPCAGLTQAAESLRADRIAFIPAQLLGSRFASLIAMRGRLGLPGPAHLVAQALDPTHGDAVRLAFSVAGTSSEGIGALAPRVDGDFIALTWPAGRSPLTLSTRPRIEAIRDGHREVLFEADVQEMRTTIPQPPEDAQGMARWIKRVMSGAIPVPVPAVNLVAACLYAVGHAPDFTQAKAVAAVSAGRLAA